MKNLRMQQEMTDRGRLEIRVNARIQARPVSGARVTVSYTGDPQNVIEELITDGDGRRWIWRRRRSSTVWNRM